MEFVDVIIEYIERKATQEEKDKIGIILRTTRFPPINPSYLISNLTSVAIARFEETNSKLQTVRLVKDITGWGIRDAKNWVDSIFNQPQPPGF